MNAWQSCALSLALALGGCGPSGTPTPDTTANQPDIHAVDISSDVGSVDCDDGESCTVDSHAPAAGCAHEALADGASCGSEDVCKQGICIANDMVQVPAGPFWMGCNEAIVGQGGCPYEIELPFHEVWLDAFLIDVYEVTVERYAACVKAGACTLPVATYEDAKYYSWGNPGREKHPITGVNRAQAAAFCQWTHATGRLPTEAQWEKAARGGCDKRGGDCAAATPTYPWGNQAPDCELTVMITPPEKDCFPHACGEGCATLFTSPVGSRPKGISPYGVHDMTGNVSEFVADCHLHDAYKRPVEARARNPLWTDCKGDPGDEVRGGSYSSPHKELRASDRHAHPKGAVEDYVGFRCVR